VEENVILLVEDNENDEILTVQALKDNNITTKVVVARGEGEAIDYVYGTGIYADRKKNKVPVLALMHMRMPKLNALNVLSRIRANEETKLLPVVILTSSAQEKDIIDQYKLGAKSYIVNPLDGVHLSKRVKQLKIYWLLLNQRAPTS